MIFAQCHHIDGALIAAAGFPAGCDAVAVKCQMKVSSRAQLFHAARKALTASLRLKSRPFVSVRIGHERLPAIDIGNDLHVGFSARQADPGCFRYAGKWLTIHAALQIRDARCLRAHQLPPICGIIPHRLVKNTSVKRRD